MNGNGHESPEKRAFARIAEGQRILDTDLDLKQVEKIAAMRGSVYGPLPRPLRFIIPRRNLRRALGIVALFLACSVAVILLVKW